MRKFLLASSAITALMVAAPAGAADMPVKARPLPPPPPACAQFGGFYVGGNVGYLSGEQRLRDVDGFTDRFFSGKNHTAPIEYSGSKSGWAAGVQGGYNWQFRCTVFGIEADYNWTKINRDFFRSRDFGEGDIVTLAVHSSLKNFGTIRGRTGVVVDNLLLYVTGGLAFARTERSIELSFALIPEENEAFSSSNTRWGWTAGFGAEWALGGWGKAPVGGGNWSIKLETLFARFEPRENTFICALRCDNVPFRFEHDSSAWTTRIGLNYRFDWGKGPVGVRAAY
jgi:outer membrane immunogenic protein